MKKAIVIVFLLLVFMGILGLIYNKNVSRKTLSVSTGDACPLSEVKEAQESGRTDFQIYSPIGESTINPITQAPRLDSLDGKTIALVGGSFMASVTHPEIKRLILKNYPTAKVILLGEIGSAGPYPAPGVKRKQKDDFERKLKEMKVDAVVSGNGGCGLCTPKEEGSCIVAEYLGIPSVMIAAPGFVEQAKRTALVAGVPVQRTAVYPGAFSAHTNDELIKNTREILWKQIVDGLTKPIAQNEIDEATSKIKTETDTINFSGTLDEAHQFVESRGWTDGLPFDLPVKAKVDEFFKYTPLAADVVIGEIPPAYRKVTTKHVATVGAMAGCPPEYMPILIAFTKAMLKGDFRKTLSSTHAWTPFVWINGPIARQLGIDAGQGEISSPTNKKIGRFIDLAMLNLGGYDVKENRMGTFGYLSSWAMAEDEEAISRIGWQPYHVQQGFDKDDSTITAASSLNWGNNLTPASSNAEKIMELMAWDAVEKEQFSVGSGTPFVYRTVLITEYVARDLAKKYKSKSSLETALVETARRPLEERAYSNYWANPGSSFEGKNYSLSQHKSKIAQQESSSVTSVPKWLSWTGKTQLETVPVMQKGKTAIIVTGDANRNKVMTVPGGGMATIKIELPSNWDDLMQELGYKSLNDCKLNFSKVSDNVGHFSKDNSPQKIEKRSRSDSAISRHNSQGKKPNRPSADTYRKMRQQNSGRARKRN